MSSGESVEDAIFRCSKQHWVSNKNKYLKAKNKVLVTKGLPELPPVTIKNAPDDLRQPNEMSPEAIVFLIFRNDPLFQIGRQTVNSDDEDYGLRPSSTSSKIPISRKKQKQAEKKRMTKELEVRVKNNDKSDKNRAALTHAEAARQLAESNMVSTKLQAIAQAERMGIKREELEGLMRMTLASLFGNEDSNRSQAVGQLLDLAAAGSQKNHPVTEVVVNDVSPTLVLTYDVSSDAGTGTTASGQTGSGLCIEELTQTTGLGSSTGNCGPLLGQPSADDICCCDKLCKSFLAGNADMEDITQLWLLHGCDTVRCTNCRGRAHRACSGQIERGNIQVDLAVGMTTWCLQCIDNTEPFEKESDAFSIAASQSSA